MDSLGLGFALLATLTALAAVAAGALATRLYRESRSEALVAAVVVFTLLLHAPVHALGWAGALASLPLALVSAALSTLVLCAGLVRRDGGLGDARRSLRGLVRLPEDGLRECVRDGGLSTIGVAAVAILGAWTLFLSWLAPSSSWDGLWYHEPMVGWALERGSFVEVEVPAGMWWVNGYPRLAENLMLWATAFADRRLIEAWPSVFGPAAVVAFFAVGRRLSRWRAGVMGMGAVLFLLPATVLQLRSTYIDVVVLCAFLCALVFVTRPALRGRDVWLGLASLAFLAATKTTGLFWCVPLGLVLLVRAASLARSRRSGWPLAHFAAGCLLAASLAGPGYLRNLTAHDNPIWPLRLEVAGVVLEGPADLTDQQKTFDEMLHELYGPPQPGQDYHDTRRHAYGVGIPFVGLPLALLALLLVLRDLFAGGLVEGPRRSRPAALALLVSALGLMTVATNPALHWARFSLPAVAGLLWLNLYLFERRRLVSLGQGAVGAMIVASLATLLWAEPGWDVKIPRALELSAMTPHERVGSRPSPSVLPPEAAFARERDIGAGDLVVFGEGVPFVGNLWNERMTNRVAWIPFRTSGQWLDALEEARAEWVVVRQGTAQESALRSDPARFRRILDGTHQNAIWAPVP